MASDTGRSVCPLVFVVDGVSSHISHLPSLSLVAGGTSADLLCCFFRFVNVGRSLRDRIDQSVNVPPPVSLFSTAGNCHSFDVSAPLVPDKKVVANRHVIRRHLTSQQGPF